MAYVSSSDLSTQGVVDIHKKLPQICLWDNLLVNA